MSKLCANGNMLLRNYVKCYLFKTYCSNLYCSPFRYNSIKTAMKNLKIGYSKSFRRPLGLSSHNNVKGMFKNLSISSFGEWLDIFNKCFTMDTNIQKKTNMTTRR